MAVHQFAPKQKVQGQYRMLNKSNDRGEIWLYGPIGMDMWSDGVTAKQFAGDLKALGKVQHIDLRINSDGGAVTDARAMYNLLVEHPAEVTVHIDGIAASAASFLAMAGRTIEISEGGFVMIHEARSLEYGTAADMHRMGTVLEQVNQTIIDTYVARTGADAKKVRKWMNDETWFTGKEAVAAGFADKIVENMKVAASLSRPERFKNVPAVLRPNRERAVAALASMRPMAKRIQARARNDNPNHNEDGRFGEGSGSGTSTTGKGASVKDRVKATTAWLRSTPAQEIISTVASSHAAKEVMTFAIGSLIAHGLGSSHTGGGFWYQEPTLEHDIATTVHNLSAHLQVTSGRAKEMVSTVINGLKSMRTKAGKSASAKAQSMSGYHAKDEDMLPTLEHLDAILDALDKFDAEADDNAAK